MRTFLNGAFSKSLIGCFLLGAAVVGCSADDGPSSSGGSGGSGTGGLGASSGGTASGSGGSSATTGGSASGGAASGGSATGGAPAGGAGCKDADILCETFDSGQLPTGAGWVAPTCYIGSYSMKVENSGQSGTGALVTSGVQTGADSCVLKYDLTGKDKYYVSVLMKITGAAPTSQHEVTFFELGENKNADDPELRMGYRGDSSCNNSGSVYAGWELGATKGPGGEYTGCTGKVPAADTWYCVKLSIDQTGAELVADMEINDMNMDYLVHSSPKSEVLGLFKANYLKLGMQSYSGALDGLIVDQVAVSTMPVGCGP